MNRDVTITVARPAGMLAEAMASKAAQQVIREAVERVKKSFYDFSRAAAGIHASITETNPTWVHLEEKKVMLYQVAVITLDAEDNETGIALEPTAVLAKNEQAATIAATQKLAEDVDPNRIHVLVRPFHSSC